MQEGRDVIVLADGDDGGNAAARDAALRWKREGHRVRIPPRRGWDYVETTIRRLVDLPCRIQQLAYRLGDAGNGNPHRWAHLSWIHEFLLQNLESARPEIDRDPEACVEPPSGRKVR
jgi:hypothetical protein